MQKNKQEKNKQEKKKQVRERRDDGPTQTEELFRDVKNNKWNYGIIAFISIMIVLTFYMQYKYEMNQRLSMSSDGDDDVDYYSVLGVDYGADLATIKQKYKDLAKIWHPDKNKNCTSCHEKFLLISKAHEVLTDEKTRGDDNSKGGTLFSSGPVFLNERNYHKLVEESNDYWVILVFENTRGNNYNKAVIDAFDDVSSKLKHIVRFGVIDVLKNHNLLHFIPYKFQYFPNIYTYHHTEGSELFENWDLYSVTTLIKFIEGSFATKLTLIDDAYLSKLVAIKSDKAENINEKAISVTDIDMSVFVLSTKFSIDLTTKDFALSYKDSIKLYQNDVGFYDKCNKVLKSNGDYRVWVSYNSITHKEKDYFLQKELIPIPIKFTYQSTAQKLQQAYHYIKILTLQKIYRNNYHKHCFNKVHIDGEEVNVKKNVERGMEINMCVIMVNPGSQKLFKAFLASINHKFKEKLKNANSSKKKLSEEYDIEINYGIAEMAKNKSILKLYNKYKEEKQIKESHDNLFLIINDTNEKFTFKSFADDEQLIEYFTHLDNSDVFEDIAFSFEYFANYEVRDISDIFEEEKVFSLEKLIMSSIYAQTQASYIFTYILLLFANYYVFKYDSIYFLLTLVGLSISISFGYSLFNVLFN